MCKKFVEIEVEATCGGDDWITIKRPCASTGTFGELLLCDECESTRGREGTMAKETRKHLLLLQSAD